jgi:UDP-N-acetylmuramyl pentapeptide phosphotransferase/UDP-N-acetylglucosamine-1-phosphate transferase
MWFDIAIMLVLCFTGMVLYLKLAPVCKLVDVPNARSSHNRPTYRGAGVLFLPLILYVWIKEGNNATIGLYAGILLAAGVGLADDIKGLSAALRAVGYLAALGIAGCSIGISWQLLPLWIVVLWLIAGTGVINAWNFMDGINGITVLYTGVVLVSSWWVLGVLGIESYNPLFLAMATGLCGVAWLNVRPKALAFLGDVGSVLLGTVAVLLLSAIIMQTKEAGYILLVLIYGLDTVITIAERLLRGENIFKAHRSHLYQYLANELGWPHLRVAFLYAGIQSLINIGLLWYLRGGGGIGIQNIALVIVISGLFYIFFKKQVRYRFQMRKDE